MATIKKEAGAGKAPVVVAAEPLKEEKARPATEAAAGKVAPARKPAAGKAAVAAKVAASKEALAKALAKAQAVKLTPRPAPAVAEKPAGKKAEKPVKPAKAEKPRKPKLVRDSFTMPESEYAQLAALKKRLQAGGVAVKKSELLRAGVALLAALKDADLAAAAGKVEKIKTGRPAKSGK